MEIFHCNHVSHTEKNVCVICGSYLLKSLISGVKTYRFVDQFPLSHTNQLKTIRDKLNYFKINDQIVFNKEASIKLSQIIQNHRWGIKTQAKGMYFYSHFMINHHILQPIQQFKYAAMCLFLAVKVQEHTDMKSLRRYRRECDRCFELEEFYDLEAIILQQINFDFNISTFVDMLEFYMIRGVVFSNQKSTNPMKVQDKIMTLAKTYIRNGMFVRINQYKLAAFIVYKARQQTQCTQVWNWSIEQYSQITVENVKEAFEQIKDIMLGIPKERKRKSLLQCLAPVTPRSMLGELQNFISILN